MNIESLEKQLESDSENYRILSNLTLAYYQQDNLEKALLYSIRCVKANNIFAKGWARLGTILQRLGRNQKAMEAYEKAVELDNSYADKLEYNMNQIIVKQMPEINDIMQQTMATITGDEEMMQKMTSPEFKEKVMALSLNPLLALQDPDIMKIINNVMSSMKLE